MRIGQIFVYGGAAALLGLAFASSGHAADTFRKLKDAEIKARLAGMEITDGVHWAEQYMRDGTYKAFHLGKPSKGKWFVRDGELCLDEGKGKGEPDCREVWISGNKIEFRGTGLEGVLQAQQKRGVSAEPYRLQCLKLP
jgi:hypothetical protein